MSRIYLLVKPVDGGMSIKKGKSFMIPMLILNLKNFRFEQSQMAGKIEPLS